ncbi:MAG: sigma-70 family RNA polymerase sigma factor [Anaerolineae bacterium]|nr:sigma-70 family RNA polymerase sigma factor [Anaerolineae bacterium]
MVQEQELLRGARSLEEAALGEVFDTYYPALYRYIYYHIRHRETAEDLTAEVFTRMLEQLAEGCGPSQHLRAWLYRVAYNVVVDESRRQAYRDHDPLDDGATSGDGNVERQAEHSLLRDKARVALGELTPDQRAVLILKYLEGYGNRDVARMLGTTIGAVKALQYRGLVAMRRRLRGGLDGDGNQGRECTA